MRLRLSFAVVGLLGSTVCGSAPAIARPVTAADLSGRSVCWSNGDKETYSPGGKYRSSAYGPGAWQFISAGVVAVQAQSTQWSSAIEKLPDGSLHATASSGQWTGRYCK